MGPAALRAPGRAGLLSGLYARQKVRTLFARLEAVFTCFGGVPRELLFNQIGTSP